MPNQQTPKITVNSVSKRYGDGKDAVQALSEIDIEIAENEFVSIVGPSGCGKSTLLHLIAGLEKPTTGNVQIGDQDVQSSEFHKKVLGLVFQHPVLLEWQTVRKNVMLPIQIMHKNGELDEDLSYYRERAGELIELVGLDGFGNAYPQELSGGMQQRVTISQSLMYDPEVLLMDEPFGSLDEMTKNQLHDQLLDIWQETRKTIFFVTHDLDEAVFLSDRVLVLSQRPGEILDEVRVDLPRPRTSNVKNSEAFVEITSNLYSHFK